MHEEIFDGTHRLTDKTRTSIKVPPSLRSFYFWWRVPPMPQTKIKQALWENTGESLATLLVVLAHPSTVQKFLSVPARTVAETQGPVNLSLQPKRSIWMGTTRGTGGHHHASCFSRRTHREKTTPCAHRAPAYHPALWMSATTTVTRCLELTSKLYPPLHWIHATTTHRYGSCFKGQRGSLTAARKNRRSRLRVSEHAQKVNETK